MRVLVTGGRDYNDYWVIERELRKLGRDIEIIEGGARGADQIARRFAIRENIPFDTFVAEWLEHGPKAGPIRNQKMIEEGKPDLVIAFPGGKGTEDCVRRALRAGIEVRKVEG
jgi:hypothetical protein